MVQLIQHLPYIFIIAMEYYFKINSDGKHILRAGEMGKWSSQIYFPKHKSDQIGLNNDEVRHVYSNPTDPSIYPLRALASYLFVLPSIFGDGKKLFPGKDQKNCFNTCLYKVTKSNSQLYKTINVKTEELGSHSICKGTITNCCAGVHPGPKNCLNLLESWLDCWQSQRIISKIWKCWRWTCWTHTNWNTNNQLWFWNMSCLL